MTKNKKTGDEVEKIFEESWILYYDDDDTKKSKVALISKEMGGVTIKITADGTPFFIPYNRVLKIKPRTPQKEDDRTNSL